MATRMQDQLMSSLETLRYEPTGKRVRGLLAGSPALDTSRALLVWEPRRIVPQYAVPVEDVLAELVAAGPDDGPRHGPGALAFGGALVLTPDTGFGVHSADGAPLTLRLDGHERPGAAFRLADPDLDGYAVLDFSALDSWLEEDEEVVSHPRDPFHRVDVRRSSRHVQIALDGQVLAESRRPSMLFETGLPARYYLPPDDVDRDLLRPSDTVSACAYKGVAAYWSVALSERTVPDIVWSYPAPLPDAGQVTDLMCFFTERVDLVLDGLAVERPHTPWS